MSLMNYPIGKMKNWIKMKQDSKECIKMPIKDLAKKIICDGHLYLKLNDRKFYMMKPGVYVDPGFVKKHAASNVFFDFESVVDPLVMTKFRDHLKELKYLQFERDIKNKCFEIVCYFHEAFSKGHHFLNFVIVCHEEFCQFGQEHQLRMHETDMHLFRKSIYSAAFAVIIGMTNEFFHYPMLRDFWNLTFALDIGLCEENYSYFVAEACNTENRFPGNGLLYLMGEGATDAETDVFLGHPEKSYQFLQQNMILTYPELSEAVLYQHELAQGNGFPRRIKKSQVSGWEAVVILSDALVEILPEYHFELDVINYL